MPGFMPGIHVLRIRHKEGVDGRAFRREDRASRLLPGHDNTKRSYCGCMPEAFTTSWAAARSALICAAN